LLPGALVWGADRARDGGREDRIAGRSFKEFADELRRQLFEEFLPFWENGAFDEELGGIMCYLYDDGSVQDDRKDIWYQGRGIWVYSYLFNHIDPNPKWLDRASRIRDFMVEYMHQGDGTWIGTVDRRGNPVAALDMSRGENIYGALFAAVGLIQLAKVTGGEADLELAKLSIRKSVELYETPSYGGIVVPEHEGLGLRAQGHSFMFVWVIPQLLDLDPDPWFESVALEHLDHIENDFWNAEYGISNETLLHDYSRIPSLADQMVPGHSVETQWMAMDLANRLGDNERAARFRTRMRRLIEMNWDHVFDGLGDLDFHVFASDDHPAGPDFSVKAMWAQCEILVGALKVYSETGDAWALRWYERGWEYIQRTMRTDSGVWTQAVDRRGNAIERPGISAYRKGNFHQPRALMMNLVELEKALARD